MSFPAVATEIERANLPSHKLSEIASNDLVTSVIDG